jgi:hypothetical protein
MNTTSIIEQIRSGAFDKDLGSLSTEIQTRLTAIRGSLKNSDFGIGDKVRFNSSCGTRYLIGHTATVVGRKKIKLVVKLDAPTGRFVRMTPSGPESAQITVPIGILDPA